MSEQRATGPLPAPGHIGRSCPSGQAVATAQANVLLISGNRANLQTVETILDDLGLNLVRAGSAEEAMLRLSREDYAVALFDVQTPGSKGLGAARLIRERPETRHLPLIFLRPLHDLDFPADLAYTLGAVDYLEEPLIPVILRAKVSGFVELFHHKERMRQMEKEAVERQMAEERFRAEVEQQRRHAEELARLNAELASEVVERRRAEMALREADRHKDEFLAMLAHELRNPLAPLRNSLSVLCLRGEDPAVREQALPMAERQVEQLTRLLDDLMDLSRIRQGKLVLKTSPLDLNVVVANAVETVRSAVEARRHKLEVAVPPTPVSLTADPVRLQQVFVNLLTNACRYTPPGGFIRLGVDVEGGEAVVRVRDTGIGLAPDMLTGIFTLYTQADRAREQDQSGLGIGLALVRGLVTSHGGSIAAHSEGPGRGSEFVVRLPLRSLKTPPPPEAAPRNPTGASPSLRILVVEDNEDAASSLAFLLEAWGHRAVVAHDGPSALTAARSFQPGVAFVDIGLPGMDGHEVGRRLRQEAEPDPLLLVALTGHGMDDHRRLSHESGFAQHLVKPVDPDALRDLLVRFATSSRRNSQVAGE